MAKKLTEGAGPKFKRAQEREPQDLQGWTISPRLADPRRAPSDASRKCATKKAPSRSCAIAGRATRPTAAGHLTGSFETIAQRPQNLDRQRAEQLIAAGPHPRQRYDIWRRTARTWSAKGSALEHARHGVAKSTPAWALARSGRLKREGFATGSPRFCSGGFRVERTGAKAEFRDD